VDRHDFTLSPTTTSEYQQLEQPWAICGQPSVEMSRPLVWSWSGGLKSWDWALGSGLYDPELGKRRSSNALSSGRSMKRKAKRTHKTMMIIKRSSFYMNGIDNVTSTNSHTCAQTFMFIYGFLSLASSVLCIAFSIWCFWDLWGHLL